MKKLLLYALCAVLILCALPSCKASVETDALKIVATNFPSYDFARQLTKDTGAEVTMLLSPGGESHSYDPTPQDIIRIGNADVFVYVGGVSDTWASDVLSAADNSSLAVFRLTDHAELAREEEGHSAEEDHDEHGEEEEYDEHVWTSPKNVMSICRALCDTLCEKDAENSGAYKANLDSYLAELEALDGDFRDTVAAGKHKTVVFADRFPLIYFAKEYGLDYYSAFPGCSSSVEASAATVAFLIDKVNEDKLPAVFHIELSGTDICETVAEACGVQILQFNACHNITATQFEEGATYISLMRENVEALRIALG